MASKVFIVTGASKGLGAAIVEQLLAQSHKVVVTARSEEQLQKFKVAHPGQVEYLAADITSSGVSAYYFLRLIFVSSKVGVSCEKEYLTIVICG
jgi:NADP-dependent 3-hydroxy acid dehydrogenase YdfG